MNYELLLSDTKTVGGVTLYRIKSLRTFNPSNDPNIIVFAGELGGYVQSASNLSQNPQHTCWVADEACVFGLATVAEHAYIYQHACVYGQAQVYGSTCIFGWAEVFGTATIGIGVVSTSHYHTSWGAPRYNTTTEKDSEYRNIQIYDRAWVHGNAEILFGPHIYGNAQVQNGFIMGYVDIFGTAVLINNSILAQHTARIDDTGPYWADTTGYIFDNPHIEQTVITFVPYPPAAERRGAKIQYTGKIFGNVTLMNTEIVGYPLLFDNAVIKNTDISDGPMVYGNATVTSVHVLGQSQIYGNSQVSTETDVVINIDIPNAIVHYDGGDPNPYTIISGRCKIYDNAIIGGITKITGDAKVYGDSHIICAPPDQKWGKSFNISDNAKIHGNALITMEAVVQGHAQIDGNSVLMAPHIFDYAIVSNSIIIGNCSVYQQARIYNISGSAASSGIFSELNEDHGRIYPIEIYGNTVITKNTENAVTIYSPITIAGNSVVNPLTSSINIRGFSTTDYSINNCQIYGGYHMNTSSVAYSNSVLYS